MGVPGVYFIIGHVANVSAKRAAGSMSGWVKQNGFILPLCEKIKCRRTIFQILFKK